MPEPYVAIYEAGRLVCRVPGVECRRCKEVVLPTEADRRGLCGGCVDDVATEADGLGSEPSCCETFCRRCVADGFGG